MLKTHLKLANGVSECGFFTSKVTDDISKVTCKFCLKLIKKSPHYQVITDRAYNKLVSHSI